MQQHANEQSDIIKNSLQCITTPHLFLFAPLGPGQQYTDGRLHKAVCRCRVLCCGLMMPSKNKKVTMEQQEHLVSWLESHSEIAAGRFLGKFGKVRLAEEWQAIAAELNSFGFGVVKDYEKWQQTWRDWKGNIKKKVARMQEEARKTGSGRSEAVGLTAIEQRIINILGWDALVRLENDSQNEVPQQEVHGMKIDPGEMGNADWHDPLELAPENKETKAKHLKRKMDIPTENPVEKRILTTEERFLEMEETKLRIQEKQLDLQEKQLDLEARRLDIEAAQIVVYDKFAALLTSGIAIAKRYLNQNDNEDDGD